MMERPNPIKQLFQSRKFILALAGVLIDLFIVLVPPEVAPRITAMREELLTAVTVLFTAVIGGIAVEDHGTNSAPTIVPIGNAENVSVTKPTEPPAEPPPN